MSNRQNVLGYEPVRIYKELQILTRPHPHSYAVRIRVPNTNILLLPNLVNFKRSYPHLELNKCAHYDIASGNERER